MSFESLGLSAALNRAVAAKGYTEPTPVQSQAIPAILEGRDLMAAAQTGTGKTAGFTLPLLQRLAETSAPNGRRRVRALILAPTRELAQQVQDSVRDYGRHLPLQSWAVFGGIGIGPQITALRRGVDILVATPGRLLDLMNQRAADLSGVEYLVLDEADRMLDMGFIHDIRKIIAALPAKRQNLMFSATFAGSIRTLANGMMTDPVRVQVAAENTAAENVTHTVHAADKGNKRALLAWLIGSNNWRQVLVFARTKHGADRLAKQLEADGLKSTAIHGNKTQHQRTRALETFKRGGVRVLVATDVAARGLDIDHLPHVVNYDLPNVPEDYIHRIGRTGRAGRDGTAISLVSADERADLHAIERLLGFRIERRPVEGFPDFSLDKPTGGPRKGNGKPSSNDNSRQGKPKTRRWQGKGGQAQGRRQGGHGSPRRQGQSRHTSA